MQTEAYCNKKLSRNKKEEQSDEAQRTEGGRVKNQTSSRRRWGTQPHKLKDGGMGGVQLQFLDQFLEP